jgi:subtilisin family serine protease
MTMHEGLVQVAVFDYTNALLEHASVVLTTRDTANTQDHILRFDAGRQRYTATGVAPGRYVVTVQARDRATEHRDVQVDLAGLDTMVIVGEPGMPFFYRGAIKVPFQPYPDLLAVALDASAGAEDLERILGLATYRQGTPVAAREAIRQQHIHVFRFAPDTSEVEKQHVQESLSEDAQVTAVGPLVRLAPESLSFLTDEIVVKFQSHVTLERVVEIARRFNTEVLRRVPQAGNAFLLRVPGPVTYAVLETAAQLVASGLVEYAEPNLVSSAIDDAITPTDFLYPMQWHLPLIHCPEAWQALSDTLAPDVAFGSPDIVIAVIDEGVEVTHPEFTGSVSNGTPKVYQVFDFGRMVPNNDRRAGSGHGTCCAGLATALPNNPAAVAGQHEGVVGVAGNCRLMAIRRPSGLHNELGYSDMYMWIGGFEPASGTAGFPARISPGADVITTSFGYSEGLPISGLMKDTFDYLTSYGRGGRGTLLFFSVGNESNENDPRDFTLLRPWAAYTRTFAVAASTLETDGVMEIRAPYSNIGGAGILDFCMPSASRKSSVVYNPPRNYGIVTAADTALQGTLTWTPNAPSHITVHTTTADAAVVQATNLAVASSAGFAVGQFIVIGTPGTAGAEFNQVRSIPDGTHLRVIGLKNAHPADTIVSGGPDHSVNNFGGTSAATPLAAGVGALLLSARPSLTWIQVRDLLRSTAVHIDAANTSATGQWYDINGLPPADPGYAGPFYSRWYGFGRIDALAAVNAALTLGATGDVIIRKNVGDNGSVPATGRFWDCPDIWVRNVSPAAEGAAALPANYATPGPTQDVVAAQDNYIYVRVKNIGPVATSTFYIRVYLTHWAGTEFVYPDNFIPSDPPGQLLPFPLVDSTHLIGEVQTGGLGPNASEIVTVVWPAAAIPPQEVMVGGSTVHWHPCLLVEISPQDGPLPSGPHVWDNNNLGQKNVTITYAADDGSFASALVAGNLLNASKFLTLRIDRAQVPAGVRLYLDVLDLQVKRRLKRLVQKGQEPGAGQPLEVVLLEEALVLVAQPGGSGPSRPRTAITLPPRTRLKLLDLPGRARPRAVGLALGHYRGREVFWLQPTGTVHAPLLAGRGALVPFVVGGVADQSVPPGAYLVGITQKDADGQTSGAAAVELRIRGQIETLPPEG